MVEYSTTMRNSHELELGDELLRLGTDGPTPARTAARTVATDVYTSPSRHAAELAAVRRHPAAAAHASDLAMPGDFVTTEVGGMGVIVARDREGRVRAMHNACAHRGATVETRAAGSARAFSCGFHGWSYQLDGSLRSVADAKLFSSAPCGKGLQALACEERHGMVWVTADPTAAPQSVRNWLGDELDDLLTYLELGTMVRHAVTDFSVAANWKLLTDGFLELYHLKYLHRKTIAPHFPANTTRSLRFGDHLGNALPKNRLLKELTTRPRHEWQVYKGVTMPIVLMPGTVIEWQAGHVEVFSLRPDPRDPGRTLVRLWLAVPADRAAETELWDRNWERVTETVTEEDFAAAEDVQRNIDAGTVTEILIGANEELLCEHLDAVDRITAATTTDGPSPGRVAPVAIRPLTGGPVHR
jgi:phenylpropionate dioxygenase-like ring-hydroxylating dioxygenase large terminal subunit